MCVGLLEEDFHIQLMRGWEVLAFEGGGVKEVHAGLVEYIFHLDGGVVGVEDVDEGSEVFPRVRPHPPDVIQISEVV